MVVVVLDANGVAGFSMRTARIDYGAICQIKGARFLLWYCPKKSCAGFMGGHRAAQSPVVRLVSVQRDGWSQQTILI